MSDPVDPKCVTPHPHAAHAVWLRSDAAYGASLPAHARLRVPSRSSAARNPPPAEPMRLLPISSPRQRRFASTTGVRRRSRCRGWRQTALSVRTLGGLDRLVASWLHALGVLRGGSIESSPHMPGVAARNSGPGSNCSRRMADTVPYMDAAWARILYCSRRGT
jgi:hypothetical protein